MSFKDKLMERKGKILFALVSLVPAGLVASASAASFDLSNITALIESVATEIMPAFVTLVINAAPVLIALAIIGFIIKFMDKILEMIKM